MGATSGVFKNVIGMIKGLLEDDILLLSGTGTPVDGSQGSGVNNAGIGSTYVDKSTGFWYTNIGTKASPKWRINEDQIVEITLTNAQVLALIVPVTMIAAPGAGKYIRFKGATFFFDRTAAYTANAGDDLQFKYVNDAGTPASQVVEATGFLTAATDAITTAEPKIDVLGVKALFENQPLVLDNIGVNFGGGDAANTVRVVVEFKILPTLF